MSRAAIFAVGLVALGAVLGTWLSVVDAPSKDLMVNRAWVERMPKSKKDMVTWFVPIEVRGKRFGVAQKQSHYAFGGERFLWTAQGGKVRLAFQQTDRKVELQAKAYPCKGKAPSGFDYCLDLSQGGRKTTMYSKKAWKVPRDAELDLPELAVDEAFAGPVGTLDLDALF